MPAEHGEDPSGSKLLTAELHLDLEAYRPGSSAGDYAKWRLRWCIKREGSFFDGAPCLNLAVVEKKNKKKS